MLDFQTRIKLEFDSGSSVLNMNFHCDFPETTYDIYDVQGRVIKNGEISSDQTSIDLSGIEKDKCIALILDGNRIYIQNFDLG